MKRIGFYPGSFDPVTLGHTDVIARACRLVDKLVIGVGVHDAKQPLFYGRRAHRHAAGRDQADRRHDRHRHRHRHLFRPRRRSRARSRRGVIVRGLRDATDFDYEMQMAGMNGAMAPGIETVFVAAAPGVRHIAANLVRQIARWGATPPPFVSPAVAQRLKAKKA